MKKPLGTLIGSMLILVGNAGATLAVQVKIDPAEYAGQWTVDYGPVQRGIVVVDLGEPDSTTGFHVVSIGGAELFFNVAADGTVRVKDRFAARGGLRKLTFKTTTVAVNPKQFQGNWRVTDGATPDLVGRQVVTLVAGLGYYSFKVGANGGFFFHITRDGRVRVQNGVAAKGGRGSLMLKNTKRFSR